MHYHIYCNNKNISTHHLSAIEEFQKRLSAYCETTLHVHISLALPKDLNPTNHHFLFIQSGISTYTSEQFADYINTLQHSGQSTIHVIIGYDESSFYDAISHNADYNIPTYLSLTNCSLSPDTKTLLFYEQLYRGYTILQGKTYHK